jgi:hypothetical protein
VSRPLVAGAHNAPPTAALAVPLSLAGAIILLASGLALHHRRKLAAERELCNARLAATSSSVAPSSSSSSPAESTRGLRPPVGLALDLGRRTTTSTTSTTTSRSGRDRGRDYYGDSEKALFAARALLRGGFPDRADDTDYDRRREGVAAYATYSRAHGAPEPRQRTRQPDPSLDLAREFTIPRRRAHPSYREIFGDRDRHGVRRGGTRTSDYNGGGASSLWRSLSIARRKVPPPSASSASPALTESVASVTSEVLPSYLPSPSFVGGIAQVRGYEHGASTGDSGFENVPLSPPPPPPLHTRGEAVEPDDSRMRELRGVYEAVAHALGSTHRV